MQGISRTLSRFLETDFGYTAFYPAEPIRLPPEGTPFLQTMAVSNYGQVELMAAKLGQVGQGLPEIGPVFMRSAYEGT